MGKFLAENERDNAETRAVAALDHDYNFGSADIPPSAPEEPDQEDVGDEAARLENDSSDSDSETDGSNVPRPKVKSPSTFYGKLDEIPTSISGQTQGFIRAWRSRKIEAKSRPVFSQVPVWRDIFKMSRYLCHREGQSSSDFGQYNGCQQCHGRHSNPEHVYRRFFGRSFSQVISLKPPCMGDISY